MLVFFVTLNRAAQRLQNGILFSGRRRRQAISIGKPGSAGKMDLQDPPPPQPRQAAFKSALHEGTAPWEAARRSSAYWCSHLTRSAESGTTPLGRDQLTSGEKSRTNPAEARICPRSQGS